MNDSVNTNFSDEDWNDIIEANLNIVSANANQYLNSKADDADEATDSEPEANDTPQVKQYVRKCTACGLSFIPIRKGSKVPKCNWKEFQSRIISEPEIERSFSDGDWTAVVGGAVSGNLEVIDFDKEAVAFEDWKKSIPKELMDKLIIEKSPHGIHVYYCYSTADEATLDGNQKLAMNPNNETLIETRAEGGYCVCYPSDGYVPIQGTLEEVQTITLEERDLLLMEARKLNEYIPPDSNSKPEPANSKAPKGNTAGETPLDSYNRQATIETVEKLLEEFGWEYLYTDKEERRIWKRPGKKDKGGSANIKIIASGIPMLNVFSTNATPFEVRGYNPFQVYSLLKCNGNYKQAVAQLADAGYGDKLPKQSEPKQEAKEDPRWRIHRNPETFTEFPLEAIPPHTRKFITENAKALRVDPGAVAMSILTIAGSLIGGKIRLDCGTGTWYAYPTIWTALVAPSGKKKSPTMKSGIELIDTKEDELDREYRKALAQYIIAEKQYNAKHKVKKGEEIDLEKVESRPEEPQEKILVVSSGFSQEGLVKLASENPDGFLIFLDELTELFNQISKSSDIGVAGEVLKGYNGEKSRTGYKNKEKNVHAKSCRWSMLGGITPDSLRKHIIGSEYQHDGLLARFLLIFPPSGKFTLGKIDAKTRDEMAKILCCLADLKRESVYIDKVDAETGEKQSVKIKEQPFTVTLEKEVVKQWEEWQEEIYYRIEDSADDCENSLLSKSEETTPRIAVILHVLERVEFLAENVTLQNRDPILYEGDIEDDIKEPLRLETWESARAIADWAINETRFCYRHFGFSQEPEESSDKDKDFIVQKMLATGSEWIKQSEITHWGGLRNDTKRTARILNEMVTSGILLEDERENPTNRTSFKLYKLA